MRANVVLDENRNSVQRAARAFHFSFLVEFASDGQRVFFHSRDLEGARYNDMEVGASVFFELIADPVSGPRATRVRATASERCL